MADSGGGTTNNITNITNNYNAPDDLGPKLDNISKNTGLTADRVKLLFDKYSSNKLGGAPGAPEQRGSTTKSRATLDQQDLELTRPLSKPE